MTTTTRQNHPPPKRRRGYAFSQSGPARPGCPTYGVAVAVQGEDGGGPGGAASVGGAHVSRPGRWGAREEAGVQVPRRGLCPRAALESGRPVPPSPRARPAGRARAEEDPSTVSALPASRGQPQITTLAPSADEAGRKVSGPRQSGVRPGGERGACGAGGRQPGEKGAAGGLRARDAVPGAGPGATGCAVQGAGEAGGARRARSSAPAPAGGGGGRAVGGAGHPGLVKVPGLEVGKGAGALRRSPRAFERPPSRLTSGSAPLPQPTPLGASVPEPGRGRDPGSQASSPDAPAMEAAGPGAAYLGPRDRARRQPAPWSRAPGAARPLLAAASSFRASPGLRPGRGAARRGRAAAAADRGRPAAAGSLYVCYLFLLLSV
ncbi:PREDICTED: skin secretory protein xP2-like [Hipposideros armiger]|uniref:Skin secretory protein xP2-like n=1 Tax=Hipposideros armiger TaxID=186990 RepID=A0A8B7S2P5_HIPAR|nr:PREDICTED: skin secretory protein xP2-like [Hipposideros armiger]